MIQNETKKIFNPDIINIDEDKYIEKQLVEFRQNRYYDITLYKDNKALFLGRFEYNDDLFEISVSNSKILIYSSYFDNNKKTLAINKVYVLYDINEDMNYACTELEALNLFKESMDSSNLKNKNHRLIRYDSYRKMMNNKN